ncbi:hypothetical protein SCARD494_00324 [Seiridium cardinale]
MAQAQSHNVTNGGKDRVNECAKLMASVFDDDPVYNWFLCNAPDAQRQQNLLSMIQAMVKATVVAGGHIVEAGDWGSSAAFCPPLCEPDGALTILRAGVISAMVKLGYSPCKRVLVDYSKAAGKTKSKGMTKEERHNGFWYVLIMGTSSKRRREGLAGALLRDIQLRAQDDGRPIWLEATTPESRQLYLKYGLDIVEEIRMGEGEVAASGQAKARGEGIVIWGMIWRPRKADRTVQAH